MNKKGGVDMQTQQKTTDHVAASTVTAAISGPVGALIRATLAECVRRPDENAICAHHDYYVDQPSYDHTRARS